MHSPLEIARNYIEVGIHKVNLSIFKTILLGFFAGMFIGFAGIASTTASSTIGILVEQHLHVQPQVLMLRM